MLISSIIKKLEGAKMNKQKSFNIVCFIYAIIATIMASAYDILLIDIRNIAGKTYNIWYLGLFHTLFPLILGIIIALSIHADLKNETIRVWIPIIIINLIIVVYRLTKMMLSESSINCLLIGFYIVYYISRRKQLNIKN